jgi:hypothetical protein
MQQDAPEFFAAVRNTSIQMVGATPIDADQKLILVAWVFSRPGARDGEGFFMAKEC